MNNFKWGIIGTGNIAEDFAKDLQYVPGISHTVQAVLTRDAEDAEPFIRQYNISEVFTDLNDFVKAGIDAVYIATPHTLHHEQALACLQHNIPVLCEKPITINAEQLRELINASREHNTFLMEGMWIRFLPSIRKVMELVQQDKIGEIISVKAGMSYKAPYDPESRFFNPDLGGGSLLDLGIYPVFLATLLLGKPAAVKAAAAVSDQGIDEACSILLDYPAKQYAMLESSIITNFDRVAEIDGKKGRIKILSPWNETPEAILLEIFDKQGNVTYPCEWQGRGFQYEIEETADCLQHNTIESSLMPHQLSLQVMEIMDEVRKQINVKYEKYE